MVINTLQLLRYTLALSWIYHGLVPKLLHIAPMEEAITASLGFSPEVSYWITKTAGIAEITFGIVLMLFYRQQQLVWLNIAALAGLLGYVALFVPQYLFEAFNPVTTNISLIVISLILLNQLAAEQRN